MNVIPIFAHAGITGFESPANEYTQLDLDLDQLLIEHPSATFLGYACGDSMQGLGIFDRDLLIVDRCLSVKDQDIIVAANRQAKEAGIEKFKPYFQVKALCEQKGIIALSSNYELYADLSAKMMQVIGRFAPEQHIYSIDESFLSFERSYPAIKCFREQGMLLRRAVWREY